LDLKNADVVDLNTDRRTDTCQRFLFLSSPVHVQTLRWAHPPFNDSHQIPYILFFTSILLHNDAVFFETMKRR
jgi:hypothetical protein